MWSGMCTNHLHTVLLLSAPFLCSTLWLKGYGTGVHGLFLFPPCFRKNVVATCKIGSFLCSLDNLLQRNVIVLFFGNQIWKWRLFEKRAIFYLLFTFFSHTYTYFAHPIDFFALPILKKIRLSETVSLWYESWCWFLFAPF